MVSPANGSGRQDTVDLIGDEGLHGAVQQKIW